MKKYINTLEKFYKKYVAKDYILSGLVGLAILVLAVSLIFLSQYKNAAKNKLENEQQQNTAATTTEQKAPAVNKAPSTNKAPDTSVQAGMKYEDALEKYSTSRLQFNGCVAAPAKFTYKNNVTLMFDNRNSSAITVYLDGKANTISALSYKLITLSSKDLPHTVKIDCAISGTTKYNIASVTLQQ